MSTNRFNLAMDQKLSNVVPQGSVMSPTLFNVHFYDLEDTVPNLVNINTCNLNMLTTAPSLRLSKGVCAAACKELLMGEVDGQSQTKWL
jgi:hypothetical protein